MKRRLHLTLLTLTTALIAAIASVPTDWLAVFYRCGGFLKVKAIQAERLDSLIYVAENDAEAYPTHLQLAYDSIREMRLPIDSVESISLRSNIAKIYIDTDSPVDEIPDKENYLTATFRYVPSDGLTDSLSTTVSIRGRGNTTWTLPKKPYRLKFDKKQELAGLKKAKSFVLIANFLDGTLMKNAVAFKMAELLGLPFTNTPVPVDVVLNGRELGSYMLTEKIGINGGSVDIDEERGILWEIDDYYDETPKFRSTRYRLPCMVKDPDFLETAEEDPVTADLLWNYWKADLDIAIDKVYHGKWQEAFDAHQLAKYILVNNLAGNFEISQGKSVYLYKEAPGEKYRFGPVWDFDWAFAFAEHAYPWNCQFLLLDTVAYDFWIKIFRDPEFQKVYKEELDRFLREDLEVVLAFIDEYADRIRISAYQDAEIWPDDKIYNFERHDISCRRFDENVAFIKDYLVRRANYMPTHYSLLLY